jgi:hypothetical protein
MGVAGQRHRRWMNELLVGYAVLLTTTNPSFASRDRTGNLIWPGWVAGARLSGAPLPGGARSIRRLAAAMPRLRTAVMSSRLSRTSSRIRGGAVPPALRN